MHEKAKLKMKAATVKQLFSKGMSGLVMVLGGY